MTGRQVNGITAQLAGIVESRKACAALDVERLTDKIADKTKALAAVVKKLEKDKKACAAYAKRCAAHRARNPGQPLPLPTKASAKEMLDGACRTRLRAEKHARQRGLQRLRHKLDRAAATASGKVAPDIVFGGKHRLKARAQIHPNDRQAIAAWRKGWNDARSAGFMIMGGKDETTGNKSCKLAWDGTDGCTVALALRLPDALVGKDGQPRITIGGITLPEFGRAAITEAITRNRIPGDRVALTYRFVRDPDFRHATLSAWRVCITIKEVMPEVDTRAPAASLERGKRMGVDINADGIALTLINEDGNPTHTEWVPLVLRGLSSEARSARIFDAAKTIVERAAFYRARLVLELLDFSEKKKEMARTAARSTKESGYRRMLSSLAYSAIASAIHRRAQRHGVSVGFVNPAYTSLIGEVNLSRRYGLTRHAAAAAAIARRDAGFSERINYIRGLRGRRSTCPAPEEARQHVWRQWSQVHRERHAAATAARKGAHPTRRGKGPAKVPNPGAAGRVNVAVGGSP